MERKTYSSDVSNEEWALVAPDLTLMTEDAPQRDYPFGEQFDLLGMPLPISQLAFDRLSRFERMVILLITSLDRLFG